MTRVNIRVAAGDDLRVWTFAVGQGDETNTLPDGRRRRSSGQEVVAKCGTVGSTDALHPHVGGAISALESIAERYTQRALFDDQSLRTR